MDKRDLDLRLLMLKRRPLSTADTAADSHLVIYTIAEPSDVGTEISVTWTPSKER